MADKKKVSSNPQSYHALDIANSLIALSIENGNPLTQVSILKLLYFMNASYLVNNKIPLIIERFEAWNFGPVLRSLYENNLSKHGANPIQTPLTVTENPQLSKDKEAQEVINTIYQSYGDIDPFVLVNKTHRVNGAWYNSYCRRPYSEISDEAIISEFTPLVVGDNNGQK